jgi:hypothetical protein
MVFFNVGVAGFEPTTLAPRRHAINDGDYELPNGWYV